MTRVIFHPTRRVERLATPAPLKAAQPGFPTPGDLERRSRRLALIVGAHSSEVYPQIRNRDGVVVKWWVAGRGWYSEKGEAL